MKIYAEILRLQRKNKNLGHDTKSRKMLNTTDRENHGYQGMVPESSRFPL